MIRTNQILENIPQITIIEDIYLAAYLVMRGKTAFPFIVSDRVNWEILEHSLAEIADYHRNPSIPIKDYVRVVRDLRSEMYQTKTVHRQLTTGKEGENKQ